MADILVGYGFVTFIIIIAAGVAHSMGDLKGNILAFIFWPLIAVSAVAIYIRDMWRK